MTSVQPLQYTRGSKQDFDSWKLRAGLAAHGLVDKRVKSGAMVVDAVIEVMAGFIQSNELLNLCNGRWFMLVHEQYHMSHIPYTAVDLINLFISLVEGYYVRQDDVLTTHEAYSARLGEERPDESPVDLCVRLATKYHELVGMGRATITSIVEAFLHSCVNPHRRSVIYPRIDKFRAA